MKILYVTTLSNTINTFLIPHIKMLINEGHTVDVAFNIEQEVKPEIKNIGCKIHEIPFQRSPLHKNNVKAFGLIKKVIVEEKYDIIHTHTPIASAITRLACKELNWVNVFYTAHGFHFYKGAPLINWLAYYPVEKWLSKHTDMLITINKEDYNRSKKLNAKRVEYVPGVGIDLEKVNKVKLDKLAKKREVNIPEDSFVLLSVGELNTNKNHEVVIRALAEINNEKIHYVICGQGRLKKKLSKLSIKLGIEKQVHLLGFRTDILEICNVSDVFVFPSYREGLSVAVMEAMASGLPIIASNIRGNSDLIENEKGGYLVNPNNVEEMKRNISTLYTNLINTNKSIGKYNKERIEKYDTRNVVKDIAKIYRGFYQNKNKSKNE